jgi:hypothetical protein
MQTAGYEIRIAQMVCDGFPGCHVVVEAKLAHGWVVGDPLYDLTFRRPTDGRLASFAEVKADWNLYRLQAPNDYDPSYDYDGVRYTNWDRIPYVTRALHGVLRAVLRREARGRAVVARGAERRLRGRRLRRR